MNLVQAQNWELKWHLVYSKSRMLLIVVQGIRHLYDKE